MLAAKASSCVARPGPRLGHRGADALGVLQHAARDDPLADVQAVAVEAHDVAVADLAEDLVADAVEQRDAGAEQDLRARGWGSGRWCSARR